VSDLTVAQRIRNVSQKRVRLVDAPVSVLIRTMNGRGLLEAGLLPLTAPAESEQMTEEEAEAVLERARRVAITQVIEPKLVLGETKDPNELSINDLTNADILLIYSEAIKLSDSRFYGANHRAFPIDKNMSWAEGQARVCAMIDAICCRWSLSHKEVLSWTNAELAEANAIIEGSNYMREKKKVGSSGG
jgi:hypothetical protein